MYLNGNSAVLCLGVTLYNYLNLQIYTLELVYNDRRKINKKSSLFQCHCSNNVRSAFEILSINVPILTHCVIVHSIVADIFNRSIRSFFHLQQCIGHFQFEKIKSNAFIYKIKSKEMQR